jgi:uncharacterized membrane protein YebE (DUF533 family)
MPIDKLFSNLTSSPSAQGALGGAASGAVVSMLMNKKARQKIGGSVATLGGAAALAGVGYFAYQKWQQAKGATPPAETTPPRSVSPETTPAQATTLAPPVVSHSLAMKMVKAMIAAAHSDGQIDDAELAQLESAVAAAGLTPEEHRHVMSALNTPPCVNEVAALAETAAEAAELYGAAISAIDPDTVAEKFFLRQLATALKLDPALAAEIRAAAAA